MDIQTVVTALGGGVAGASITATTTARVGLRTSGTAWRAAHAKNTYEALLALHRASNPDTGSVKGLTDAADDVRMTVTGELRKLAEAVALAGAEYLATRDRLGDPRHAHTLARRALKERALSIEAMRRDPDAELDSYDVDTIVAYRLLRDFYADQDKGRDPDPAPVREALLACTAFHEDPEKYAKLLVISLEQRQRIRSDQMRRNRILSQRLGNLTKTREALQEAVAHWQENPPRRKLWRRRPRAVPTLDQGPGPRRRQWWRRRRVGSVLAPREELGRAA